MYRNNGQDPASRLRREDNARRYSSYEPGVLRHLNSFLPADFQFKSLSALIPTCARDAVWVGKKMIVTIDFSHFGRWTDTWPRGPVSGNAEEIKSFFHPNWDGLDLEERKGVYLINPDDADRMGRSLVDGVFALMDNGLIESQKNSNTLRHFDWYIRFFRERGVYYMWAGFPQYWCRPETLKVKGNTHENLSSNKFFVADWEIVAQGLGDTIFINDWEGLSKALLKFRVRDEEVSAEQAPRATEEIKPS